MMLRPTPFPTRTPVSRFAGAAALAALPLVGLAPAAAQTIDVGDALVVQDDADLFNQYTELSLEELMGLDVSSVTGVEQDWFTTPAAVYVITREDIRRTGHLLLPEVLRLVPGMDVGRIGSNRWAVGSRGFSGLYSNKLQVLVDGRPIYDPLFSGTLWEVQGMINPDIERIEVIRGPGATLWGANAVNGVINVSTLSARETQGLYLSGGVGTVTEAFGSARYGGQAGDNTWYRVWGNYLLGDNFERVGGGDAGDDWDLARTGFRIDHDGPDDVALSLQGEIYHTDRLGRERSLPVSTTPLLFVPVRSDDADFGGHLSARISQSGEGSGWTLQAYYDRAEHHQLFDFEDQRDTFDVDWRHHFDLGDRNEVVWGLGYRYVIDDTRGDELLTFEPVRREFDTVSAFIQDTFAVVPDRLFVMAGAKLEHNDFSGFELQPSIRGWWTPNRRHTVWGSVSRAVRVPTRLDHDVMYTAGYFDQGLLMGGMPNGVPVPVQVLGTEVDPEELMAYEAGYRVRLTDDLTLEAAAFLNRYDDLVYYKPSGAGYLVTDEGSARSHGGELGVVWRVADNWRLEGSYSFIDMDAKPAGEVGASQHQFQVRSYFDITDDLELNSALYFTDGYSAHDVDPYIRADVGVTWRPRSNLELALWGQNLLEPDHLEARDISSGTVATEIPRGVYLRATLRF